MSSLRKCFLCGRSLASHQTQYCPRCRRFSKRLWVERFSPETIKAIFDYVRTYGFVCYYTGMRLDTENTKSPWYVVFDHWIPHDGRKVVLTSALLNCMKTDLTEEEFWYFVKQLNNHKKHHSKVRKMKLRFWYRLFPGMTLSVKTLPQGPTPKIKGKKCCLCGKPVFSNHSMFCLQCAGFAAHVRDKRLPASTVKDLFDYVRKYGFVCYYTGMRLDMHNRASAWYGVLDHWIPHNNKKVVLTSALLNDMKADLTEKEFWYYIGQLADFKMKHSKIRKRNIRYWYRISPPKHLDFMAV